MLTICNTGVLAATGAGTALGIILQAQREGKRPVVFACETRPLLQGARLTIFELRRAGVDVRLMVDSAAASVVGRCDMVLTGADRIARNGDTANKVGTRMLAVLARHARKPFYVAAPSSTLDPSCRSGADIPIEERSASEVRSFGRCRTTLPDTAVYNPAFDVTPGRFVSGFVFEGGVVRPPYQRSLKTLTREQTARPVF
jgi:methylthioribose-1-phosphate isomerase